ncbi:MAG: PKD domain-containing protein, partial [Bacteroidota bacterium]
GYSVFSGTSMATPHVSGAILLLKEAFPNQTGMQLKTALYETAIDLGVPGEDNDYGNGIIDVKAAFDYLVGQGLTPTTPDKTNDAAVSQVLFLDSVLCSDNAMPLFVFQNMGTTPITSAKIEVRYSDGVIDTIVWNGNIPTTGLTQTFLPQRTFTSGNYLLELHIFEVNGKDDYFFLDNRLSREFSVRAENLTIDPVAEVCPGSDAIINATPTSGSVVWYDAATGGNVLATGNSFQTPVLNSTQTFYAAVSEIGSGGKETYVGDALSIGLGNQYLIFDAFSGFTLKSVLVFGQGDGNRLFQLINSSGGVIAEKNVFVGLGPRVIDLDFEVPPGTDMRLQLGGSLSSLFVSNSNVSYPYVTPGLFSVKSSSLGNTSYPFFYDWQVEVNAMCNRVPAEVVVGNGSMTADFTPTATTLTLPNNGTVSFADQSSAATDWLWDFGDGNTSTLQNPTHSYLTAGTFTVSLTASAGGCTDVATTEIVVNGFNVSLDDELAAGTGINVFPNPNNGNFSLSLDIDRAADYQISLINLDGREVYQAVERFQPNEKVFLQESDLSAGIYYVKVTSGEIIFLSKVVITK